MISAITIRVPGTTILRVSIWRLAITVTTHHSGHIGASIGFDICCHTRGHGNGD